MTLFLTGIVLLVVGYFTYGRFVEKVVGPDDRETPALTHSDGVDYVVLPKWKNMLIQLLNIAGVGPVIGVILGIKFGPIVFLLIPIGNIFGGAVHDFVSGMFSVRNAGCNLPAQMRMTLGNWYYRFMTVFLCVILLLVVAVFINVPANLLINIPDGGAKEYFWPVAGAIFVYYILAMLFPVMLVVAVFINVPANLLINIPEGGAKEYFWLVVGAIFVYYILATLFPVDKIIGRIYPFFGALLLLGTALLGGSLVWEYFQPGSPDFLAMTEPMRETAKLQGPVIPCLFVTIACGILSGFHATQSPIVARTMISEREGRATYYGMMVLEGIIGMIWAAGGMAIYHLMPEQLAKDPNAVLGVIVNRFIGSYGAMVTVLAVVILAITSGDTALRSLRMSLAEVLQFPQKTLMNRILLCLPLIAILAGLLFWSNRDADSFKLLWNYFAWGNQVLAASTLMGCTVWLASQRKCWLVTLVPGMFMTFVILSFILFAPGEYKLPQGLDLPLNTAYGIAGALTLTFAVLCVARGRKMARENEVFQGSNESEIQEVNE